MTSPGFAIKAMGMEWVLASPLILGDKYLDDNIRHDRDKSKERAGR